MQRTVPSPRQWVAVIGIAIVAVVGIAIVGHQWSRSYADDAPVTSRLSSNDRAAVAGKTFVINCARQPVKRPRAFTLTCGDANSGLTKMRWSTWGGDQARASARYVENDCTPTCADGKEVSYAVAVRADHRAQKDGTGYYRSMLVSFADHKPEWVTGHRARFDVDFRG